VAIVFAAVLLVLFWSRHIVFPFILALFLTYLLLPLVDAMSRKDRTGLRVPRAVASFLALAAFIGVLVAAVLVLSPIIAAEAHRLAKAIFGTGTHEPQLARRIISSFQYWRDQLYGTGVFPADVEKQLDQEVRDFVKGLGEAATAAVTATFLFFPRLLELIAVPILTFFMLLDGPRLVREALSFLPPAQQKPAEELLGRLHRVLKEYVRGQLLISLFISVVVSLGLWLMGIKVALLVGLVAFFVEVIPFFGPIIWGTMAVILAFTQAPPGSPLPLFVALFAVIAQQVDSHVVAPLIMGRMVNVHPLLLIFATLLGASTFGLLGMFLAAPFTALAKETFLFFMERVDSRRRAAALSATA
jgi:predicted PurR-regulated permease PerM